MVMHGIAGYFESTLFAPLSTCTSAHTQTTGGSSSSMYISPAAPPAPLLPATPAVPASVPAGGGMPPPPPGISTAALTTADTRTGTYTGAGEQFEQKLSPQTACSSGESTSSSNSVCNINNNSSSAEDKVMLSIVPQTHTPGMFSWFPLFIPLSQPIRVLKGQAITVHIWRYVLRYAIFVNLLATILIFRSYLLFVFVGVQMHVKCGTSGVLAALCVHLFKIATARHIALGCRNYSTTLSVNVM